MMLDCLNKVYVDKKFIGVPFEWEGKTLLGTDCAGLVCLFLKENGIKIDSENYQDEIKLFVKSGKVIKNKLDLKPLDIVYFKTNNIVFHVGIYIGYGKFLHTHVKIQSIISDFNSARWNEYFYFAIRPTELYFNNEELYNEIKDTKIGFIATVAAAVAAFAYAAAGATMAVGWVYTVAYVISYVVVSFAVSWALGAVANALAPKPPKPNFGEGGAAEGSVRYGFGPLENTATSELPIPVLYGQLKIAGNAIYQSEPGETVYRCDSLCEGEINSITDIRVNDIPITDLIGCSVTSYLGTASQNVDSRVSDRVIGLRNIAYLALTMATSDKLKGGFPSITCVAQGVKVETWDGLQWTATKTYSNNSAACIRDYLTNTRYGVGLPKSLLDDASFGETYDYCNGLVNDNQGGTESRYTINYIIDSKKPHVDILSDMMITCAGYLIWSGNRLKLRTEKVENVVQNFTMSNIVEKSFSYVYTPKDEMFNKIKLLYVDPNQNYTKVYAIAEDKINQDERASIEGSNGIVEKEIAMLGITKFSTASRLANMFLKIAKATPVVAKFKVGIYAVHCEPGDVVTVSHDVPSWTNKPFRILSMEEQENDEISIVAKEYNASIYDDSYGSAITLYQYGTPPNYLKNTSEVSGIVLSEIGWRNEDGTHIASIDVSWTAPATKDYLTGYYIEWSQSGGDYQFIARADTGSNYTRLPNAHVGNSYVIRIKTVNYYGIFSSGVASSSILIVGKDANPPDVTNFLANQYRDSLTFTWDKITSVPDIHHYEIKQGTTWATGTQIGVLLGNNSWSYGNIRNGTFTFWIKAVDNSGNYSTNATAASVTIVTIPFQNIIKSFDEHPSWGNLLSNGDFESWSMGTSSAPDGWTLGGSGATVFQARVDNYTVKMGTYAAGIQRSGADCYLTEDISVSKGIQYWRTRPVIYSCWVWASVANKVSLNIQDGTGVSSSSYHPGNSTWVLLSVTRKISASASSVNLYCYIEDVNTYALFDGAMCREVGELNNLNWGVQEALYINDGYLSGDYLSGWKDVGGLITARIGYNFTVSTSGDLAWDSSASTAFDTYDSLRFTGFDIPQQVNFFIQTSGDSGPSGDWTPWQYSDYYFRYFRTKAVLQRDSINAVTMMSDFTQVSDVPDVDEWGPTDGTYRFCPASGDNVVFTKTYYYAPNVAISVYPSGSVLRTPEVSSTTSGFSVRLRDKTDAAIQGNYRWAAHGF